MKNNEKTMYIHFAFSYYFHINQIQIFSVQIQEVKDWTISFQLKKKITSAKRLQLMLDIKLYPLPLI